MHASPSRSRRNTALRIISGMILIPLALLGAFVGGWLWTVLVLLLVVLGLREYAALVRLDRHATWLTVGGGVVIVIGFHLNQPLVWMGISVAIVIVTNVLFDLRHARLMLAGWAYVAFTASALVLLRALPGGELWIIVTFGITTGTDTLAYVVGGVFGRTPLMPRLSPKKSVEGAIGGWAGGFVIALLFLNARGAVDGVTIWLAILGPLVAIAGDLFESALKRRYAVKDSRGTGREWVPGHGGVLDRADSLLFVAPFALALLALFA